jgi:hypothetical protein
MRGMRGVRGDLCMRCIVLMRKVPEKKRTEESSKNWKFLNFFLGQRQLGARCTQSPNLFQSVYRDEL